VAPLETQVVVVGAGPTGLTLANILGMHGVSTLLIERNDATVTEPRAVSIDDETLRTLQYIDLVDIVRRSSRDSCAKGCGASSASMRASRQRSCAQDLGSHVSVALDSRIEGNGGVVNAQYVVACDGAQMKDKPPPRLASR
jgi:pyruvate/2-oxoglutarate dehydrogenase complex dihydrolipoamide dehydrogenase (E3) component